MLLIHSLIDKLYRWRILRNSCYSYMSVRSAIVFHLFCALGYFKSNLPSPSLSFSLSLFFLSQLFPFPIHPFYTNFIAICLFQNLAVCIPYRRILIYSAAFICLFFDVNSYLHSLFLFKLCGILILYRFYHKMHIPIENIVTVTVTITNKFGARISAFNVEYYDPTNISSKKMF